MHFIRPFAEYALYEVERLELEAWKQRGSKTETEERFEDRDNGENMSSESDLALNKSQQHFKDERTWTSTLDFQMAKSRDLGTERNRHRTYFKIMLHDSQLSLLQMYHFRLCILP